MEWKLWKLLTEKEKEEYDFKYGDISYFWNTFFYTKVLFRVYILIWVMFGTVFSYLNLSGTEVSKEALISMGEGIAALFQIGQYFITFVLIVMLFEYCYLFYKLVKRKKWIKDKFDFKHIINRKEDKPLRDDIGKLRNKIYNKYVDKTKTIKKKK